MSLPNISFVVAAARHIPKRLYRRLRWQSCQLVRTWLFRNPPHGPDRKVSVRAKMLCLRLLSHLPGKAGRRVRRHLHDMACLQRITAGGVASYETLASCRYDSLAFWGNSLPAASRKALLRRIHESVLARLRTRKVITVGFLVYSSSEWQCDKLYWRLEEDSRFHPVIIICGNAHGTRETIATTYERTRAYFHAKQRPYRLRYAGYAATASQDDAADCDILVYLMPYTNHLPVALNWNRRFCSQLIMHIPYGCGVHSRSVSLLSLSPMLRYGWLYASSVRQSSVQETPEDSDLTIVASGLPKIDELLEMETPDADALWKQARPGSQKILYAPHWSMQTNGTSTFAENGRWFLNYAASHPETSWIVRPHPRFAIGALFSGVFFTLNDIRAYFAAWDALPNARVVPDGDYFAFFSSSDVMITDSISFLMEYQYTGKPLLRLLRDGKRALCSRCRAYYAGDVYGELNTVLYTAYGHDTAAIANFITDTAAGKDPLNARRKAFFTQYLDYWAWNGCSATESIFRHMLAGIFPAQHTHP